MATTLDYLNAPEFADDRLSETINVPPYVTGRPAQLGVFTDVPLPTTYVRLGVKDDEITIIPARERGGEPNVNMKNDKQGVYFDIPHFPLDDAISPANLQNILAWGEDYVFETLTGVVNDKMASMRGKHDATWHHLDWGALKGLVVDAEGKVLVDLFDEFGITQTSVDFAFGTAATNVASRIRAAKQKIRTAMRGAPFSGVRIFAGAQWFDAYTAHKSVIDALSPYPVAGQPNPARDDVADLFPFAGAIAERIEEEFAWRKPDGTFEMLPAVAEDEAIMIPIGSPYFKRYNAPPDTIGNANRAPKPDEKVFISTHDLPHGKGKEVHTESNILPICQRPQLLIKLTMS